MYRAQKSSSRIITFLNADKGNITVLMVEQHKVCEGDASKEVNKRVLRKIQFRQEFTECQRYTRSTYTNETSGFYYRCTWLSLI